MNIGLLGLTLGYGENGHSNKGCEALSYSFLEILNILADKNGENYNVFLFIPVHKSNLKTFIVDKSKLKQNYTHNISYSNLSINIMCYLQIKNHVHMFNNVRKCDVVFDFTGGDSFTDIYGLARYETTTKLKKSVIKKGIPFVLGSQTIGPFNNEEIKKDAVGVILKSKEIYVRDTLSLEYTEEISGRKPKLTTDIAFFLPYQKSELVSNCKIKVGFNPSGLLWCGGYTQNNQFNLKADYKEYCERVIEELLKTDKYEVHLVAHSFDNNMQSKDNDNVAIYELNKKYPSTIIANDFKTAMDAKSYIASMDVFVGARMHATIGAFSAGVPVIPFSYSRKFQGLYNSLEYNYVIDGKEEDTESAINKTLEYIDARQELKQNMKRGNEIISERSMFLLDDLDNLFHNLQS